MSTLAFFVFTILLVAGDESGEVHAIDRSRVPRLSMRNKGFSIAQQQISSDPNPQAQSHLSPLSQLPTSISRVIGNILPGFSNRFQQPADAAGTHEVSTTATFATTNDQSQQNNDQPTPSASSLFPAPLSIFGPGSVRPPFSLVPEPHTNFLSEHGPTLMNQGVGISTQDLTSQQQQPQQAVLGQTSSITRSNSKRRNSSGGQQRSLLSLFSAAQPIVPVNAATAAEEQQQQTRTEVIGEEITVRQRVGAGASQAVARGKLGTSASLVIGRGPRVGQAAAQELAEAASGRSYGESGSASASQPPRGRRVAVSTQETLASGRSKVALTTEGAKRGPREGAAAAAEPVGPDQTAKDKQSTALEIGQTDAGSRTETKIITTTDTDVTSKGRKAQAIGSEVKLLSKPQLSDKLPQVPQAQLTAGGQKSQQFLEEQSQPHQVKPPSLLAESKSRMEPQRVEILTTASASKPEEVEQTTNQPIMIADVTTPRQDTAALLSSVARDTPVSDNKRPQALLVEPESAKQQTSALAQENSRSLASTPNTEGIMPGDVPKLQQVPTIPKPPAVKITDSANGKLEPRLNDRLHIIEPVVAGWRLVPEPHVNSAGHAFTEVKQPLPVTPPIMVLTTTTVAPSNASSRQESDTMQQKEQIAQQVQAAVAANATTPCERTWPINGRSSYSVAKFIGGRAPLGSSIAFSCNKGFALLGPSNATCTTDGWSDEPPLCRPLLDHEKAAAEAEAKAIAEAKAAALIIAKSTPKPPGNLPLRAADTKSFSGSKQRRMRVVNNGGGQQVQQQSISVQLLPFNSSDASGSPSPPQIASLIQAAEGISVNQTQTQSAQDQRNSSALAANSTTTSTAPNDEQTQSSHARRVRSAAALVEDSNEDLSGCCCGGGDNSKYLKARAAQRILIQIVTKLCPKSCGICSGV